MSDSPIFSQLNIEFAAKGAAYEDLVRFSTPAFFWGSRFVVQLDKQPMPALPTVGETFSLELPKRQTLDFKKPQPLWADKLASEGEYVTSPELTDVDSPTVSFGQLISDYVAQVGQSFADQHPLAIVTDTSFEKNDDGGMTMTIEAVQPITSVQPLSERNSASPME